MSKLQLNNVKKLEFIIGGQFIGFLTDFLDRAGVKGYTVFHGLSGKGSQGFHEGHVMFNDDDVLVMVLAAVPEELVSPILEGLEPFYEEHSGVVFVSDIQVTRRVKFSPAARQ